MALALFSPGGTVFPGALALLAAAVPAAGAADAVELVNLDAWRAAAYEGVTVIREEGETALGARELKTALSYVVLPSAPLAKEVLLVRSVLPATSREAFQPVADAAFFAVGPEGELSSALPAPPDPCLRVLDRRLAAEIVPDFAMPEGGEVAREDLVRIGGTRTKLPFTVASAAAGGRLRVTRRLKEGAAPRVDLDGTPYAVEAWSEEWVFDPERRVLSELRRAVKIRGQRGAVEVVLAEENELLLKEARTIDEGERPRVLAMAGEARHLLGRFAARGSARDLYAGIDKLGALEGAAALPGLKEALLVKLSYFRQERVPAKAARALEVKPAPAFTLSALDGTSFSFPGAVKGNVVLLVFWGYACGPCRLEAPYLTKLEEKFGARGFKVIAVNGYNEPQALIARFVAQAGLKHTILLMGGEVARRQYSVNAYPTCFWVDHQGNIVEREAGFSPAKVPSMEARIEKMLLAAKPGPATPPLTPPKGHSEGGHGRPAGGD